MPVTGLTMPFTVGYDYAWDHPLLPSGVKFVCRYLSHDPTKNLTKLEVALLRGQGLHIVANWEFDCGPDERRLLRRARRCLGCRQRAAGARHGRGPAVLLL